MHMHVKGSEQKKVLLSSLSLITVSSSCVCMDVHVKGRHFIPSPMCISLSLSLQEISITHKYSLPPSSSTPFFCSFKRMSACTRKGERREENFFCPPPLCPCSLSPSSSFSSRVSRKFSLPFSSTSYVALLSYAALSFFSLTLSPAHKHIEDFLLSCALYRFLLCGNSLSIALPP